MGQLRSLPAYRRMKNPTRGTNNRGPELGECRADQPLGRAPSLRKSETAPSKSFDTAQFQL